MLDVSAEGSDMGDQEQSHPCPLFKHITSQGLSLQIHKSAIAQTPNVYKTDLYGRVMAHNKREMKVLE